MSIYDELMSNPDLAKALKEGKHITRVQTLEIPTCDECKNPLRTKYRLCSCGRRLHTRCERIHLRAMK